MSFIGNYILSIHKRYHSEALGLYIRVISDQLINQNKSIVIYRDELYRPGELKDFARTQSKLNQYSIIKTIFIKADISVISLNDILLQRLINT